MKFSLSIHPAHSIWKCVLFASAMVTVSSAIAAPVELVLQLDSRISWDSNPLRFPEDFTSNSEVNALSKNDRITQIAMRGAIIVPIDSPETRLLLSGQLGSSDYKQFENANSTERGFRVLYQWRLGQLWRGEVSKSSQTKPYQFQDGSLTDGALVRTDSTYIEAALRVTPEIDFPLKITQQTVRNDNRNLLLDNQNNHIIDLGARWKTGRQSSFRTGYVSSTSRFVDRNEAQIAALDSKFQDHEAYVSVDWQYSIFTQLEARLGYYERKYENISERDFSVIDRRIKVTHNYSPLTLVSAEVWNRPSGTSEFGTLYSIDSGSEIAMRWSASAKTRIDLKLYNETRRYRSSPLSSNSSIGQSSKLRRLGAGVVHAFTPDIRFYADGFRESQSRNGLGAPISQNVVRVGIEYTFENIPGIAVQTGYGGRR